MLAPPSCHRRTFLPLSSPFSFAPCDPCISVRSRCRWELNPRLTPQAFEAAKASAEEYARQLETKLVSTEQARRGGALLETREKSLVSEEGETRDELLSECFRRSGEGSCQGCAAEEEPRQVRPCQQRPLRHHGRTGKRLGCPPGLQQVARTVEEGTGRSWLWASGPQCCWNARDPGHGKAFGPAACCLCLCRRGRSRGCKGVSSSSGTPSTPRPSVWGCPVPMLCSRAQRSACPLLIPCPLPSCTLSA